MRFFEQQDWARRSSRRWAVLYLAAALLTVSATTLLIVWLLPWRTAAGALPVPVLLWTAAAVCAVVAGGTLSKIRTLSRGGAVVAESLGGQRLSASAADPQQRRLLNVVEEMAIASGMPLPRVYVLPEQGINALAAGLHPRDAVIAVTQGALDRLSREELQAVVAHEFSHILNGDMRLNMHLAALLYGLSMIGLSGHYLLLGQPRDYRVREDEDGHGSGGLAWGFGLFGMALGAVLMAAGGVGVVLAGWLQAAVCRRREYLADAAAVQFTRQSGGLVSALHHIGTGRPLRWQAPQAPAYAHFMFAPLAEDWLLRLSATHPTVLQRIGRINAQAAADLADTLRQAGSGAGGVSDYSGWLAFGSAAGHGGDGRALVTEWQAMGDAPVAAAPLDAAAAMLEEIRRIHPEHMAYAAWLRQSLPAAWYAASQDGEQAEALVCALMLSADADIAAAQLADIEHTDYALALRTAALHRRRHSLQAAHVLPLLDLALPALAALPEHRWPQLQPLLQRLMRADRRLRLHDWCVWTLLHSHLNPPAAVRPYAWTAAADDAAQVLAWAAATQGGQAAAAYAAAAACAGLDQPAPPCSLSLLQAAVTRLNGLNAAGKSRLLAAVLCAIGHQGRPNAEARGYLRALAANLRYPMPPLPEGVTPPPPAAAD